MMRWASGPKKSWRRYRSSLIVASRDGHRHADDRDPRVDRSRPVHPHDTGRRVPTQDETSVGAPGTDGAEGRAELPHRAPVDRAEAGSAGVVVHVHVERAEAAIENVLHR